MSQTISQLSILLRSCAGFAASFALAHSALSADAAPPQSLSAYRDKNRLLLVFAPTAQDSRYKKQDTLFQGKEGGLNERDLVRFNVFVKPDSTLRKAYGVKPDDFRVVLVGKDGHTAYSASRPIVASDLFRRIDRMPMRRDEMRRRGRCSV